MKKILLIITIVMSILLFDKVDALTITSEVQKVSDGWMSITNASDFTEDYGTYYFTAQSQTNVNYFDYYISPVLNTNNADYVTFYLTMGLPSTVGTSQVTQTEDFVTCRTWTCESYNNSGNCSQFKCLNWYVSGTSQQYDYEKIQYEINSLQLGARVYYENNSGWSKCNVNDNEIVCPTNRKNVDHIRIELLFNPTYSSYVKIGIGRAWNSWKKVDIQGAIENQTQEIINQNATYTNDPYEEVNGTQEMNDFDDIQNEIMDSLNFDVNGTQQITFNPQASLWIWNIVDRFRQINPAIVLLMTSLLGIGIIKMVLNR